MATKQEKFEDYESFVGKFKTGLKKTTDDCYTPPRVFEAVKDWAIEEYSLHDCTLVRPFWPGGDYEAYEYPDGCVVLDNPPFSILASITRYYAAHHIDYFLFCPYLTSLSVKTEGCNHIITDSKIVYHNGAVVNTSFLTSLGSDFIRTAPGLAMMIDKAMTKADSVARTVVRYDFPPEVLTATMVGRIGKYGGDFRVSRDECRRVTRLDAQAKGKGIFGSGYLLSRQATDRKTALLTTAVRSNNTVPLELSERERRIVEEISD